MQNLPGAKEWFYCASCDVTYLFQGNETLGCKEEDEEVRCHDCKVVIGHLRCDGAPPALQMRWQGHHIGRTPHE
jgi:hypothetical protein